MHKNAEIVMKKKMQKRKEIELEQTPEWFAEWFAEDGGNSWNGDEEAVETATESGGIGRRRWAVETARNGANRAATVRNGAESGGDGEERSGIGRRRWGTERNRASRKWCWQRRGKWVDNGSGDDRGKWVENGSKWKLYSFHV